MIGFLFNIARAITAPGPTELPASSRTSFSIKPGSELEGLPEIKVVLKSSVATEGDSDYLRTVDQGRHLHVTDLGGDTSFLISTETGSTVWSAQPGQFLSGVCNGKLFLSIDKSLVVRNLETGKDERVLEGYSALGPNPSGTIFYALDAERRMCRLDSSSLGVIWSSRKPWPKEAPLSGCYSNCGRYYSVQTGRSSAQIWEVETGACLFDGELGSGAITRMRPHPLEPVFAFSTMSGLVWLLDARTPKEVFVQPLACESRGVGFTGDGNYLVAVNSDQHEFLWILDYHKQQLFAPFSLKSDPWGVAAWGTNQVAVAHSNRIDFYQFEIP